MIARGLTARIEIAGVDVTLDVSPYLTSINYEDVLSGETDTLELELVDRERLFIGAWFPTRGDTLRVELAKTNWQGDGLQETLPLGLFEIDEVTLSYPPSTCRLKGNSCSQNSALRQVDASRAWENVKLSAIAQDIATGANVQLVYEATDDPMISRAEQAEVSALAFLEKLCADYYLSLKVADGKLIIFDTTTLERQEAVLVMRRDVSAIKSFRATATLSEVYKTAEVNYAHGKQAEQFSAKVEDSSKATGKTLRINKKVDSQAEAERLAANALREKNREELKIELTTVGDFNLLSGNVVELEGHGVFDGRWLVKRARHVIDGSGYVTTVEAYRCAE